MEKTTFRKWFAAFTNAGYGVLTEFVVGPAPVPYVDGFDEDADAAKEWPPVDVGVRLTSLPDEFLDREFTVGFGGDDLPALYGWSEHYVCLIHVYDVYASWKAVPRSPVDVVPRTVGY